MSEICDEALERLYLYLDGEIDDAQEAESIRAHLQSCKPCDGAYSFEERLRIAVRRRMQVEVPDIVIERLRVAIRAEMSGR